jgi:hypothetical protein
MPSIPPLSKNESWAEVAKSFGKYPDSQIWKDRRSSLEPVILQAIQAGYDGLFLARESMRDILVFTSDNYRDIHIKISVTEERQILIQSLPGTYTKGVLAPNITSHTAKPDEAFPILTRHLQCLWTETVTEPIPEILQKHQIAG